MNPRAVEAWMGQKQQKLWLAGVWSFIILFSYYVMLTFIEGSDFLGVNVRSLDGMMYGGAIKPHIYRQMVPWMVHAVVAVTPEVIVSAVTDLLGGWLDTTGSVFYQMVRFRHGGARIPELRAEMLYPFAVAVMIDYAFLMAYVFTTGKLAQLLFPNMFSLRVLTPLMALMVLPPFCGKFAYLYDPPVLFFSAWLTCLLVQGRLTLFTVMLGVASINKETTIYLWAVFIIYGFFRFERAVWLSHAVVGLCLIVAVKAALMLAYADAPGDYIWTRGFFDHVLHNLDGYGMTSFLGVMAGLLLFGGYWAEKPLILRCWLAVFPGVVLAGLLFGMRHEYRVLYEAFPPLLVAACHTLARCAGWDTSLQPKGATT